MDVLLDTSFLIPILIKSDKTDRAREFFINSDFDLGISVAVMEETMFVGLKLLAAERIGLYVTEKIRKHIKEKGYDFASDFLKNLKEIIDQIEVVEDVGDFSLITNIATEYGLMPNDALIVATCKHYGIKKIATFDEDFERVDFLEIVEP